jgi:hypothetical protein
VREEEEHTDCGSIRLRMHAKTTVQACLLTFCEPASSYNYPTCHRERRGTDSPLLARCTSSPLKVLYAQQVVRLLDGCFGVLDPQCNLGR